MANVKVKVAKLSEYDGSPSKFHDWLCQLTIYICACKICDANDKILLTLSYMKSGTTSAWVTWFFDEHEAHNNLGGWNDFLYALWQAFEDKILGCKAQEKIETFRQGSHKIDDFITRFNVLVMDTSIDVSDMEWVHILEKNVHPDIIDRLNLVWNVPQTYLVYHERILSITQLWEQRQEQHCHGTPLFSLSFHHTHFVSTESKSRFPCHSFIDDTMASPRPTTTNTTKCSHRWL
jgi:hypothetical protein